MLLYPADPLTAFPDEVGIAICPATYDPSDAATYVAGTEVEVEKVIYRCKTSAYSYYCTQLDFQPDPDNELNDNTLWTGAWEVVGPCRQRALSGSPSVSPTLSTLSTLSPSQGSTSEPTPSMTGDALLLSPTSSPSVSVEASPRTGLPINPLTKRVPENRFVSCNRNG